MAKKNGTFLFNAIAPFYALFYAKQKQFYQRVLEKVRNELNLASYGSVLDVGCGPGALCSALHDQGFSVTGVDPADKMLSRAKSKPENNGIRFIQADVLRGLPFPDDSFDVCIACYVAHGMQPQERRRMYAEMSRVAKKLVIIHDYNQNRSFLTSAIEWLERGDYFRFILDAEKEMKNCVSEMKECFSAVKVIDVDVRAAWYVCTPVKS